MKKEAGLPQSDKPADSYIPHFFRKPQSGEKFARLFYEFSEPIIFIDQSGKVVNANIKAEKTFDLMDIKSGVCLFRDLFDDAYKHIVTEQLTKAVAGEEVMFEALMVTPSGKEISADIRAEIFDDSDHKVAIVRIIDISEIKGKKKALKKSRELLETVFEINGDQSWQWNFNSQSMILDGVERKGYITDNMLETIHPDDRDTAKQHYIDELVLAKKNFFSIELRAKAQDNHYHWKLFRGKVIRRKADGTPSKIIGTSMDFDRFKKIENDLIQSEQDFRQLFERAHDAILIFNQKTDKIVDVNHRAVEVYGYSREEFIGMDILTLTKNKAVCRNNLNNMLRDGGAYNLETLHYNKNGKEMFIEINSSLLNFKAEDSIMSINRDISERKNAEAERESLIKKLHKLNSTIENQLSELSILNKNLMESEEQLADLVASKDRFFSIISHDLKNPFRGFQSLTKALVETTDKISRDELKSMAEAMHNSADQLSALLGNLLQWSGLQTGTMICRPEEINLNTIVRSEIDFIKTGSQSKNISIENNIPKSMLVIADNYMLKTIIRNLLSNAIKFTNPGGAVVVCASDSANNFIEVSVEDNGVGIQKSTIDKLFRIDHNTSAPGTENETGTGLGLILCKDLVKKHDGSIRVESEPDQGSKFIFTVRKKT
ncbi:MAG: PAS domain S-box protein [Chlorobi bacterium]|nr:PAS domain S-box protein [Chlorobiota bacterium]